MHEASRATAGARPWVERLARFGFAAKGVVYALVGFLALKAALGAGGKTTDPTGALSTLVRQPYGRALLGAIAVGLFGYALWRLVQTTLNPGGEDGAKGIVKRIGYGVSGVTYVLLGASAVRMATGGARGGESMEQSIARLMAQPQGQWLVGGLGACVLAVGLYFLYRAYSTKFREEFKIAEMSPTEERWATLAGRVGYAARGIVFGLIGWFLIQAALHANAREARGLGDVLSGLAREAHGPWLLGLVAAGLMAYGAYMLVAARYRRVWA